MNWNTVAANWPAFLDRIEQTWPETDQADLINIDGDRARFATYLAKKHELTRNEANEEIDEWLMGSIPTDVVMDEFHDNASIMESARHIPPGEDVYSEDADFGDDSQAEAPVGRQN